MTLRYGLYAVVGVVLLVLGWRVAEWRQGYVSAKARIEAVERESNARLEDIQGQLKASQEASQGYHDELEKLRSAPPAPVVRLCPKPRLPAVPKTTPGTDETRPETGELSRDIGPDLVREAQRADELAAQLRALQGWLNSVGNDPKQDTE